MTKVQAACLLFLLTVPGLANSPTPSPLQPEHSSVTHLRGLQTLSFEANHGQTDSRVKFISRGFGYSLFLTSDEAALKFSKPGSASARRGSTGAEREMAQQRIQRTARVSEVIRARFLGANPAAKITGIDPLPGRSNYFRGKDPRKWRTNVPSFARVQYQQIYPGIDLVFYGKEGQLEYDFIVAPGARPERIGLEVQGAERIALDEAGNLVLAQGEEQVLWRKPVIYQDVNGSRKPIAGRYLLGPRNQVRFAVDDYDRRAALVIDPVLSYSTYLGGNALDQVLAIAVDAQGNAYLAGDTASVDFPSTSSFGRKPNESETTAFVTKLNSSGSGILYSTYVSGSFTTSAKAIAIDREGNAYITGHTDNGQFPTTPGAFQEAQDRVQLQSFVVKINPSGSDLVFSTLLGGSRGDVAWGIALDAQNNVYVAGVTSSADFPTTSGVLQPTLPDPGATNNAFVTKLNSTGSALIYSTYLGGSGADAALGMALAQDGSVYVGGTTTSGDFPVTPSAFQSAKPTQFTTSFVSVLSPDLSKLAYSTFLGGRFAERITGIAVDSNGNAYVTGQAQSPDFPTTPGAYQRDFGSKLNDMFVSKIDPRKSGPESLTYSTFVGQGGFGRDLTVDASGSAYVTGAQGSLSPVTADAFESKSKESYLAILDAAGSKLLYATFFGGTANGSGGGVGDAISLDTRGNIYLAGNTDAADFFTTPGAFDRTCGSDGDCNRKDVCRIAYDICNLRFDGFAAKFVVNPDFALSVLPQAQRFNPGNPPSSWLPPLRTGLLIVPFLLPAADCRAAQAASSRRQQCNSQAAPHNLF